MATPVVQAASCAGASTAVITTTVVVVPTADERPKCFIYASSDSASATGKLGKDVWMLLVDTKNSKNKDWWEWSFRQLDGNKRSRDLDSVFRKVTSGFESSDSDGNQDSKALNKLCHYHFKETATTTITTVNSLDAQEKSIWKYCSPLGNLPSTISIANEVKYYSQNTNNLGVTKPTEFISTKNNPMFWDLKNSWFKNQAVNDLFFQPFKNSKQKTLKDACEKAYLSVAITNGTTATATQPKDADVVKYCGFKVTTEQQQ